MRFRKEQTVSILHVLKALSPMGFTVVMDLNALRETFSDGIRPTLCEGCGTRMLVGKNVLQIGTCKLCPFYNGWQRVKSEAVCPEIGCLGKIEWEADPGLVGGKWHSCGPHMLERLELPGHPCSGQDGCTVRVFDKGTVCGSCVCLTEGCNKPYKHTIKISGFENHFCDEHIDTVSYEPLGDGSVKVSFNKKDLAWECDDCAGQGIVSRMVKGVLTSTECPECAGQGGFRECSNCEGTGKADLEAGLDCDSCNGAGNVCEKP